MKNKKIIILIVSILGVIGIVFGLSYAWFVLTVKGEKTNAIKAGELSLILNETGDALNITDAFPVTDEEGLKGVGTTFTLRNDGTKNVEYKIKLLYDENSCNNCKKMPSSAVKYSLMRNQVESERANLGANNNVLESGVINGKTSYSYELKIWLDENAGNEAQNAYFYGKLEIEAVQTNLVGPADESCFTFNSGTITGYSNSCTKDLVIPSTIGGVEVTKIGEEAFQHKKLTSLVIPDGITAIGDYAFLDNRLKSITIPEGIIQIGVQVFENNQLINIVIPEGVTRIGYAAFANNQLTSISIPSSVNHIEPRAFNNNQLSEEEAFIYKRNNDGSEDKNYLISYGGAKRDNIVIPSSVTTIGNHAFGWCNITSITLPDNLTSIGVKAFYSNQLTNVTIPSKVTTLAEEAFASNALTSVKIKGKANSSAFTTYGTNIFGWATGYSGSNIIWNA